MISRENSPTYLLADLVLETASHVYACTFGDHHRPYLYEDGMERLRD